MTWIKQLFSKEKVLPPADLGVILTVDVHSHLIPGIDDGSKDMEDSIAMIRRFVELGYKKIITTPHVMSDYYKNSPDTILDGLKALRLELEKQYISIEIEAAAEYYLDENLEEKIELQQILSFGDGYVLFELPFMSEPPNLADIIFKFQTNGYKPILAHPERYGFWYNDFNKFIEMKDKGVHLQLNILSLLGHYSPETQKIAERLIDEKLISFLGTDCHNLVHLDLIDKVRSKKYLHQLLESGELKNQSL